MIGASPFPWEIVLWGTLVTAVATSVGALPAMTRVSIKRRTQDVLMGFSAGVMLAATCFSLITPAINMVAERTGSSMTAALITTVMVACGGLFLHLCNKLIPHEHVVKGREGSAQGAHLKRIWLFVFAIGLHNFPEGLAVGSGLGSHDIAIATPIVSGIAMQNLPEGFVVAAALMSVNYGRWQSLMVTGFTGLIEAAAALIGYAATSAVAGVLPWALAFSGGSMLYVVSDEIIPESHRTEHSDVATAGLMVGFAFMMFLDVAFGA